MTTEETKRIRASNSIFKWIGGIILAPILVSGIVGNINMYGTVQRIDERTAYIPSVNALIVTQDMLQDKLPTATMDSFLLVFCKFIDKYEKERSMQDSINKKLLKMMKERGVRDSIIKESKAWIEYGDRICKDC